MSTNAATIRNAATEYAAAETARAAIKYGDPTDDDDPTDGGPDGGEDVPDPWAVSVTIGHDVGGVAMLTRAQVLDAFERVTGCEAYTALDASGMWRGQAEPSTRLEIVCTEAQARALADAMPELARVLSQQCVMFDARPCAVRFIEAA